MTKNNSNLSVVRESDVGLWFWQLPSGDLLSYEGYYLNMPGHRYDIQAQAKMRDAAESMGFDGKPIFKQNERRVTESEWEDQMARMEEGKIPDPSDPAIVEEARDRNNRR